MWFLAVLGCEKEPEKDTSDPTDTGVESTGAHRTGVYGSIFVVDRLPAVYAGLPSEGWGIFLDEDLGVSNLAECLFVGPPCLAEPGSPGHEPEQVRIETVPETVDAGPRIRVGAEWLVQAESTSGPVYNGPATAFDVPAQLGWDGALAGYWSDAGFEPPGGLTGLSPSPGTVTRLGPDDDAEFAWDPGGPGDLALRWPGLATIEHRPIADEGTAALTPAELGMRPPLDATWVTLTRTARTEIDVGNRVTVEAAREQWLYFDYEDTDGWTDLTGSPSLTDTCGGSTVLPDGRYYGSLRTRGNDLDLGDGNPYTGWATPGSDAVFPVDLADGDTIEVTFRQVWLDAVVYVMDAACGEVLAAADLGFESEEEVLVFTAPDPGRYHVVLDGIESGERFALELRTIPVAK